MNQMSSLEALQVWEKGMHISSLLIISTINHRQQDFCNWQEKNCNEETGNLTKCIHRPNNWHSLLCESIRYVDNIYNHSNDSSNHKIKGGKICFNRKSITKIPIKRLGKNSVYFSSWMKKKGKIQYMLLRYFITKVCSWERGGQPVLAYLNYVNILLTVFLASLYTILYSSIQNSTNLYYSLNNCINLSLGLSCILR